MKTVYTTPCCSICGSCEEIAVDYDRLTSWQRGTLIQDAFPDMPMARREQMITGTHPRCWELGRDPEEPWPATYGGPWYVRLYWYAYDKLTGGQNG